MSLHLHSAHLLLDPFESPKVLFHPTFPGRREEKWGSFRGRHHSGVDLGIISGLEIISGSGSFRGLYSAHVLKQSSRLK